METFKVFYLIAVLTATVNSNGLENFMRQKLAEYPAWLKANDPSSSIPGPTQIKASNRFASVDVYLSNHKVQGHSDGLYVDSVTADLKSGEISVSFTSTGDIIFSGRYFATGKLLSNVSLSGEGDWHIKVPEIYFENLKMNWALFEGEYIFITSNNLDGIALPTYQRELYFEKLSNSADVQGYEEVINEAVYLAFKEYLVQSKEHPLKKMYLQYFQQVFDETKLPTILSTKPSPELTTTAPTTSQQSGTTSIGDSSLASGDVQNIQVSKTMAILIFLWIAAMTMIVFTILFILTMFIRQQSRRLEVTQYVNRQEQTATKIGQFNEKF